MLTKETGIATSVNCEKKTAFEEGGMFHFAVV
jgi:hypothetical protein